MSGDVLDVHGIDALLERFRARKRDEDALRESASTWEVDQPKVLRPDATASMRVRFAMVANELSFEIGSVLRTEVQFRLAAFEALRFRSYRQRQQERIVCFVVDVQELELPSMILADEATVSSMIDLLVGGVGKPIQFGRDLTRLEKRVIRDVIDPAVAAHASVLSHVTPLTMDWSRTLGTRDELRPVPGTEIYFLARYVAEIGEHEWCIDFLLPIGQLIGAIDKSASLPVQMTESTQERKDSLARHLVDLRVGTTIELGSADVSLTDVMELAPGDVIVLDRRVGDRFDFLVEGVRKYTGSLGRCGRSLGFQVDDVTSTSHEDATS